MKYNNLTPEEKRIIEDKETETPFTGKYDNFYEDGTFICRKCNTPLFSSKAKFDAGCGWPAFDQDFPNAVKRVPMNMWMFGNWEEIQCDNCGAHLGHVFEDERFTDKNTRHCVNSLSIRFIPKEGKLPKVIHE